MKSELGLEFPPKPINKPIFLDRTRSGGGKRFRFFDASI